jgi:hypothetical protein
VEAEINVEADADILVDADIPVRKAVLARAAILAGAATLVAAVTLADKRIPADEPIPAVEATPADEAITVGATMTVVGAGVTGIVAAVASASGTTPHLTRMVPAIPTSRTIAIPTATTINGAIGIPQPLAATPARTGINAR